MVVVKWRDQHANDHPHLSGKDYPSLSTQEGMPERLEREISGQKEQSGAGRNKIYTFRKLFHNPQFSIDFFCPGGKTNCLCIARSWSNSQVYHVFSFTTDI